MKYFLYSIDFIILLIAFACSVEAGIVWMVINIIWIIIQLAYHHEQNKINIANARMQQQHYYWMQEQERIRQWYEWHQQNSTNSNETK